MALRIPGFPFQGEQYNEQLDRTFTPRLGHAFMVAAIADATRRNRLAGSWDHLATYDIPSAQTHIRYRHLADDALVRQRLGVTTRRGGR